MVDRWTTRGEWDEHRRLTAYLAARPAIAQSDTSMLRMLNYPEIVTLANLLASEPWRAIASADRRDERLPFDLEVASQLNLAHIGFGPDDPLVAWQEGAALARRQKLHEQPGHHGPEVWLSRPHELQ